MAGNKQKAKEQTACIVMWYSTMKPTGWASPIIHASERAGSVPEDEAVGRTVYPHGDAPAGELPVSQMRQQRIGEVPPAA